MPGCLPIATFLSRLREARRNRTQQAQRHRAEKLAQRDSERRSEGLLRIALRQQKSINSFTAADPGIFYKQQAGGDPWHSRGEGVHSV
ncbi:hypothetical protein LTR53_003491 [Teratosphaeriaceae sp. CCFEE 6253]|nr:hypothetical protein LTR53_003491 [Teratosphaeriaceae sp. CCFEE 6253]